MHWNRPEQTGGKRNVPEYITLQEVCDLVKLSDRKVYDLCRQGKLVGATKIGGRWRVDKEKLLAWLEAGGEVADAKEGDDKSDG